MDRGRLSIAGEDEAPLPVGLQVLRDGARERRGGTRRLSGEEQRGDRARELLDVRRAHRQAVIRAGARDARRGLDGVEAIHPSPLAVPAARGKFADGAQVAGPAGEEVGVEREDDVGLREIEDRFERLSEGRRGAGPDVVAVGRLPLVPARLGQLGQERRELRAESGRPDRLGQDAQPPSLPLLRLLERVAHRRENAGQERISSRYVTVLERSGS